MIKIKASMAPILGFSLSLLLSTAPLNAYSAPLSVHVSNGNSPLDATLSIHAKETPLQTVMTEIALQSGIKITFHEAEAQHRLVTHQFAGLPLEQGLKRILRDNYVFSFMRDSSGKTRLTEVSIGNKSLAPSSSIKSMKIPYGNGQQQLGTIREGEGAQIGPTSFFVAPDGKRYICDTANGRLQVFDAQGNWLSAIPLKGDAPEDITLDEHGNLYIYDVNGTLYHYSANGTLAGEFAIDESRWQSRGPMHMVGDTLYARVNGSADFALGKRVDGNWVPNTNKLADNGVDGVEEGIVGLSGKRYIATLDRDQRVASINIVHQGMLQGNLSLPLGNLVSIEFIGEDVQGNFYAKSESIHDEALRVEVSKFSAGGAYLGSLTLPGSDYAFWSIKTVTVDSSGKIHQMMPGSHELSFTTYEF